MNIGFNKGIQNALYCFCCCRKFSKDFRFVPIDDIYSLCIAYFFHPSQILAIRLVLKGSIRQRLAFLIKLHGVLL